MNERKETDPITREVLLALGFIEQKEYKNEGVLLYTLIKEEYHFQIFKKELKYYYDSEEIELKNLLELGRVCHFATGR